MEYSKNHVENVDPSTKHARKHIEIYCKDMVEHGSKHIDMFGYGSKNKTWQKAHKHIDLSKA